MQLARSLAETVSRVHDPLMRAEVVSKVSARLGVSAQDFQMLVPKQRRESLRADESRGGWTAPTPRHDVAMLCLLSLQAPAARGVLRDPNWRKVPAQAPDSEN